MTKNSDIKGTWNDDPAHLLRPRGMARRSFLQVGAMAGLGVTLGDFFRMQARADIKQYESKEGPACPTVYTTRTAGIASLAGGVAVGVAAGILYWKTRHATVAVAPGSGGIVIAGRF